MNILVPSKEPNIGSRMACTSDVVQHASAIDGILGGSAPRLVWGAYSDYSECVGEWSAYNAERSEHQGQARICLFNRQRLLVLGFGNFWDY